jgi:5-methylcytosine-specific restriction endonuclease McrA
VTAELTAPRKRTRGTSNGNAAGSSEDRRRRKVWLIDTYRADVDGVIVEHVTITPGTYDVWFAKSPRDQTVMLAMLTEDRHINLIEVVPACRCYRCGRLLTIDTVTVDRIVPGCKGGTYRRDNIRPACGPCNQSTGGKLAHRNRKAKP